MQFAVATLAVLMFACYAQADEKCDTLKEKAVPILKDQLLPSLKKDPKKWECPIECIMKKVKNAKEILALGNKIMETGDVNLLCKVDGSYDDGNDAVSCIDKECGGIKTFSGLNEYMKLMFPKD